MDSGAITMVFDIFLLVVILIFGHDVVVTALVFSMSLASDTGFLKHIKRRLEAFSLKSSYLYHNRDLLFCSRNGSIQNLFFNAWVDSILL